MMRHWEEFKRDADRAEQGLSFTRDVMPAEDVQIRELIKGNRLLKQEHEVLWRAAAYLSRIHIESAQFRSRAHQGKLRHHGLRGSVGRVGACGDNATMERFFSLLEKNVLDRQSWVTRAEQRLAIVA